MCIYIHTYVSHHSAQFQSPGPYIYVCTYINICSYMYSYTFVSNITHIYSKTICMCLCMSNIAFLDWDITNLLLVCVHICVRKGMHIYIHIHTNIRIHSYTCYIRIHLHICIYSAMPCIHLYIYVLHIYIYSAVPYIIHVHAVVIWYCTVNNHM